ncbi:Retrovirus-related Pol Polyprotein from transposo n TNT 1-94 [Phytophthora megakarya]|uniref:Retrovirus-related Pol Polyprotein from transposo n TNT 1-94 n=1 Tax=Phytophthora megakarya TaxID=4795 RepID=A0A225VZK4_9STRA|nr:Retrovirus-related Pol Polyprotein from transposo n TNT 1-94 [Phytophthora megakarya]
MPGPGDDEYRGNGVRSESREDRSYSIASWCFDCATNRHLVGDKSYFVEYRALAESEKKLIKSCHGWTQADGIGTAEIWFEVHGNLVSVQLEGVFYAERHENLISQSKLEDQGFKVHYNSDQHIYSVEKEGIMSLEVGRNDIGMYFIMAKNNFL